MFKQNLYKEINMNCFTKNIVLYTDKIERFKKLKLKNNIYISKN